MLILSADRSVYLGFDLLPLPKGPHDDWLEDLTRAARMVGSSSMHCGPVQHGQQLGLFIAPPSANNL